MNVRQEAKLISLVLRVRGIRCLIDHDEWSIIIYGDQRDEEIVNKAIERVASDLDSLIEFRSEVLCSHSGGLSIGRGSKFPRVVKYDLRNVALLCEQAHRHDWGQYRPQAPILSWN